MGNLVERIDRSRLGVIEYLEEAHRNHVIRGMFEIDVTDIREALKRYRKTNKRALSLNSYLIYLFSQAIAVSRGIQRYRYGRGRVVAFEDVDMAVLVEQKTEEGTYPATHIMRRVNERSLEEIEAEIAMARQIKGVEKEVSMWRNPKALYEALPFFIRRPILRYILKRNPFLRKKIFGTVGFSALSMFGTSGVAWGLPITSHVLNIVVGGLGRKVVMMDGKAVERDFLGLTLSIDHDFVDGAPAARFIRKFQKMATELKGLE